MPDPIADAPAERVLLNRAPTWLRDERRWLLRTPSETRVSRWRPNHPTGLNVASVLPSTVQGQKYMVVPMSYDYRIDRLVLERLHILATITGRRVIAVDTPGVTMNFQSPELSGHSSVPFGASIRAMFGDATGLARLQAQAVADVTGLDPADSHYVGESLGAQFAAAASAELHSTACEVDLVEPVNARRLSIRRLARIGRALTSVEEHRRAVLLEENITSGWGATTSFERMSEQNGVVDRQLKAFATQGKWAVLSALSLAGGLPKQLRALPEGSIVRVWRGTDSLVCFDDDISHLRLSLVREQIDVQRITMLREGGAAGHHILTSLDAMVTFSYELSRRMQTRRG